MLTFCLRILGKPSDDPKHPDFIPNKNLRGYEHRKQNDGAVDRFNRAVKRRRTDNDASDTLDAPETSVEFNAAHSLLALRSQSMAKQTVDKGIYIYMFYLQITMT